MSDVEDIKNIIKEYGYSDFESIDEKWSVYQLTEDGTIIKLKVVPLKFIKKNNDYAVNSTVLVASFSKKKGEPSRLMPSLTESDLPNVLDKQDMKFEKLVDEPWNEYKLDDGVSVFIKAFATTISSTRVYDPQGDLVYFVNHQVIFKKHPLV